MSLAGSDGPLHLPSEPGRFLASFGDFGMTFRSLWAYEGGLGSILVDFLKILIFPIDFNDFI